MDGFVSYEIDLIRTETAFQALADEWRALYQRSLPCNPFLSYEWTRLCWTNLCGGAQPFVLTARREGKLVAVAPLRLERSLGFRVLRFIGDGRSDYLGFLRDADAPGAESALLEALSTHRQEWDLAVLRQLCETYSTLTTAVRPKKLCGREVEGTVAPYLSFEGDWSSLCASGPGWLKRMEKAARKFAKEGGLVERYEGSEALLHLNEVAEVERHSWKTRQGVARFQPGEGQNILHEALSTLGSRGEMELWIARMDDRPVAFELNFLTPQRIMLYQGAFNEEYRKLSPGGVLDLLSIRRAWEQGVREYDFMAGNEAYKQERTNATRSLRYLAVYPATARGSMAYATLVAPRWRLKASPRARAALQLWVQFRNNPGGMLPALNARARVR